MSTFIESCNCRGIRPQHVVKEHHNMRPTITARLLDDRNVARCIVAPSGYGKTSAAYEYAQVIFEFKHVFWIRCESPCFIRDLDAGTLLSQIVASDPDVCLVVCDDVPLMDEGRSDAFGLFIDQLLERGCEFIACCSPMADSFSSMQEDRIRLNARSLLLSDDEVEIESLRGTSLPKEAGVVGAQWRASSVAWSGGSTSMIAEGIRVERLPGSVQAAVFVLLVLGKGSLEDLSCLLKPGVMSADIPFLEEEYPYLGIDLEEGVFSALAIDVKEIHDVAAMDMGKLSVGLSGGEGLDLIPVLADILLRDGKGMRACELVGLYGSGSLTLSWLEKNGWKLVFSNNSLAFLGALEKASRNGKPGAALLAMGAWSAFILEDAERAESYSRRAMQQGGQLEEAAGPAALLELLASSMPEGGAVSMPADSRAFQSSLFRADTQGDGSAGICDWWLACELLKASEAGNGEFMEAWRMSSSPIEESFVPPCKAKAFLIAGGWILARLLEGDCIERTIDESSEVEDIVGCMVGILRGRDVHKEMDWMEYVAAKAVEGCLEAAPFKFKQALRPADIAAMRRVDMELFDQRGKWRRKLDEDRRRRGEFEITHVDPFRRKSMPESELKTLRATTPSLLIELFGGLECWVGSKGQDPRQLSRDKAKILLGILAIHHGREISREKLVGLIWPECAFEPANRNLYVVWSFLRRALSVGDSCPYLIRTQSGFKMDMRYVSCDLEAFDDLCRGLLFGRNELALWEDMYAKVSTDFADELLPSLRGNPTIDAARKRYRVQLVDGLVSASSRLHTSGEVRGSLWFAREALQRDPSREDVYIALMTAQIAADQRSAALETYFECRRYLSENLGIDPSPKVMELYRSIIESEEDF